jgi:hypothetical protein
VNDNQVILFKTAVTALAFQLGMRNALIEAANLLGAEGPAYLDRVEADTIVGIKNLEPTPNVPDEVIQESVEAALAAARGAFTDVRRGLGLGG